MVGKLWENAYTLSHTLRGVGLFRFQLLFLSRQDSLQALDSCFRRNDGQVLSDRHTHSQTRLPRRQLYREGYCPDVSIALSSLFAYTRASEGKTASFVTERHLDTNKEQGGAHECFQ